MDEGSLLLADINRQVTKSSHYSDHYNCEASLLVFELIADYTDHIGRKYKHNCSLYLRRLLRRKYSKTVYVDLNTRQSWMIVVLQFFLSQHMLPSTGLMIVAQSRYSENDVHGGLR